MVGIEDKRLNQYLTLSTVVFCLQTIFAAPISPLVENFTPSLVTEMTTTTHITKRPTFLNITSKRKRAGIRKPPKQMMGKKVITSVPNAAEIFADPSKLSRRHPNNGMIFCLWNSKVFTINVHQLHLKIRNFVLRFNTHHQKKESEKKMVGYTKNRSFRI